MKPIAIIGLSALALAAGLTASHAQAPPPPARGPAMALAVEAAQTAIATCAANGYKVSAVIVDSAGDTRVSLTADGASSMTAGFATRKAYTANAMKEPSAQVGEQAKTDTALADRIKADPKMITWAGAQPLVVGGAVIGAIGVGGAPGGDKDDICTSAAIARIKDRLK